MTRTLPNPVYCIEVWEPGGGSALYTFGNISGSNVVVNWQYKDVCTDGVGYFAFTVPAYMNGAYCYYDIDLFDTVKIKHDYGELPASWNFVGKVYGISGVLSTPGGLVRIISGLSQGEVLLRRLKQNKKWTDTDTDTIVLELATDLGIQHAADIDDENSHPSITVESETYFDLLRRLSDYWVNAGTQVKADFWVDVDNHLQWQLRPVRTTGVPTFTVGTDILSYQVTRKVDSVKNSITAKGNAEKPWPADKDGWTETLADPLWTASVGTVSVVAGAGAQKVGNNYVVAWTGAAGDTATFKRTFDRVSLRTITQLIYWYEIQHIDCTLAQCRLLAPDTTNYFYYNIGTANQWYFEQKNLGPNYEYDAATNPNGVWYKQGSPNWWDIQGIQFHNTFSAVNKQLSVDGLYFYPERWSDTASNAASITAYGQRDLEVIDDRLHSDSDCEQRSETMLFQMKDPPIQIDVTTPGDNNILVGDRVSMTIPAENISAASYDILSVEHAVSIDQGYRSRCSMVNSASIREPVKISQTQLLADLRRQVRSLATEMQRIG